MYLTINPGNLIHLEEWEFLMQMIRERIKGVKSLRINLENTLTMDLAKFNQLMMLYTRLKRSGVRLSYENCNEPVKHFVDMTNFHHVFTS